MDGTSRPPSGARSANGSTSTTKVSTAGPDRRPSAGLRPTSYSVGRTRTEVPFACDPDERHFAAILKVLLAVPDAFADHHRLREDNSVKHRTTPQDTAKAI